MIVIVFTVAYVLTDYTLFARRERIGRRGRRY